MSFREDLLAAVKPTTMWYYFDEEGFEQAGLRVRSDEEILEAVQTVLKAQHDKIEAAIERAYKAANDFIMASEDEIERLCSMMPSRPDPIHASIPCDYCVSAENLQSAMVELDHVL